MKTEKREPTFKKLEKVLSEAGFGEQISNGSLEISRGKVRVWQEGAKDIEEKVREIIGFLGLTTSIGGSYSTLYRFPNYLDNYDTSNF